jgi:hypothetical protein
MSAVVPLCLKNLNLGISRKLDRISIIYDEEVLADVKQ